MPDTASRYARLALNQMVGVAERLGDERVNVRPIAPQTNFQHLGHAEVAADALLSGPDVDPT